MSDATETTETTQTDPAAVTPPDPAPQAVADTAKPDVEAAETPEPTFEELVAKARLTEKHEKEIARLHGVLKQTKEQLRGKQGAAEEPPAPVVRAAPRTKAPESIDDLEVDADGMVTFQGRRWDPEILKMREEAAEARRVASAAMERLSSFEQAQQKAEDAEFVAAQQDALYAGAKDLRAQLLPQFTGEEGEFVDDVLTALIERRLDFESDAGMTPADMDPAKATALSLQCIQALHKLMGLAAARQSAANEKHRQQHTIKSKGVPAIPAGIRNLQDYYQLPIQEQQRIRRQAQGNMGAT